MYSLIGNLGSVVLGGAGSNVALYARQNPASGLINNAGIVVPAGVTILVDGLTGNLGSISLGGAGSSLTINDNFESLQSYLILTNNLGIDVPAGASFYVDYLSGNLGNVTLGGTGRQREDRSPLHHEHTFDEQFGPQHSRWRLLSLGNLSGNLGSVVLGGAGSSVSIDAYAPSQFITIVNNLGITVPAGATMAVDGLTGNIGSISLGGAGASLTLNRDSTALTNNLGVSVPAGATFAIGEIVGSGALTVAPTGTLVISEGFQPSFTNNASFNVAGTVNFIDLSNQSNTFFADVLETISTDEGPSPGGFNNNFAFPSISIANHSLVDLLASSILGPARRRRRFMSRIS